MTTPEQNQLLTRTGPGTPMGELFRCYWIPALLPEEIPERDSPPVRVKILSERLIAFRDSDGKLGLVDEFCAHRGVSLWFGRNEEGGLRCPYHGWKYDVTGQCVEVPSEPAESGYAEKIKLTAYPLIERGGVLWTYMGPPELQPPLPEFEFAMVGAKQRHVSKRLQECNFLQALEGGIDSSHTSFLHRGSLMHDPQYAPTSAKYNLQDFEVIFDVMESDGGMLIGARRRADEENYYWRVTQWVMPAFTAIPPRGDRPCRGHFWIPIDDENCWTWSYDYHPTRELSDKELNGAKGVYGRVPLIPGTYIPVQNKSNDYLMDRDAQKRGIFYSGIEGIAIQDSSLQESMGPIQDRTKESLVGADNGIIMVRNRLRRAALALQQGMRPAGLDPASHRVRSVSILLPRNVPLKEGAANALIAREGVPLASV